MGHPLIVSICQLKLENELIKKMYFRSFLHQCFPIILILINKFMVCCGEIEIVNKPDGSKLYNSSTLFVYGNGYKKICSYCPREYFSDPGYFSGECNQQYFPHNKRLNISGSNRTYHRVCRQFGREKDFINDVDCTFPLDIQNGKVSLLNNYLGNNNYQVDSKRPVIGTVIELVCSSGYTPVTGNNTIALCQVQKNKPRWSQELVCKRTGCFRDIFNETNGKVTCTNISNKELIANDTICSLKCFNGFETKNKRTTCLEGEWSEQLKCSPKTDTSVSTVIVAVIPVTIVIGIIVFAIVICCCCKHKKPNKKAYVSVSSSSSSEDPGVQIPHGIKSENPRVSDSGSFDLTSDPLSPSVSPPTYPSISGPSMSQSNTSSKTDLSLESHINSDPELNPILSREGEEHEEDINHDASGRRKEPMEHAVVDETEVKHILTLEPWKQDENPSPGNRKVKELELDEETIPKVIDGLDGPDGPDGPSGGRQAVNGGHGMLNRRQENGWQDENRPQENKNKELELDEIKHPMFENTEIIPKKIDKPDETFGGRHGMLNRQQENGRQPEQVFPPTRDSGVEGSNDLLSLLPSHPSPADYFVTDNEETGFPETNHHLNHTQMPSSEMTKMLKTNPEPLYPDYLKE
ncbi:uncharacterized protein LOC126830933 isoform X2 [Patella vulgata]|uniref:uncharacterized protein LOC126830933 isoform X2 n=1 Tax=Patella vulgata TaxID=6465 RepID=UPI0024A9CF67|nr:uncharacterized protein LOC126830933 isoform X2 [Patella vulgata]